MELQWPLIIFTTLVAWSAGLFGSQALMAAGGHAKKSQTTAWIASAALLVVGGVAVFFHLEHWERIFNSFGHITSGITQELIAIVVLAVVAVAYLAFMRRSDDGASVPKWLAWLAVAISAVLVVVMAHSYSMAARPAWDGLLQIGSLIGAALLLGPLTMAFIMAMREKDTSPIALPALIATAAGAVLVAAYAVALQGSGSSFVDVGLYFDPTHPTARMADPDALVSSVSLLLWLGGVIVGGVVPAICAALAWKKPALAKVGTVIGVACAFAGALCLRMAFYQLGLSAFMFY